MSGVGAGGGPWLQLFGAIAQGAGALMSAQAAYTNAKLQSGQAEYDADQAEKQGRDQAALIRRAGRGVLGSQRAGYAASGVVIGEGSAGEVERQTVVDTEHDAFQAILGGERQALALRTQAKLQKIQAKAALTSTLIDPLMASNNPSNAMSGWKTRPKPVDNAGYDPYGYTGTNDPSPYAIGGGGMDWFQRNGSSGD